MSLLRDTYRQTLRQWYVKQKREHVGTLLTRHSWWQADALWQEIILIVALDRGLTWKLEWAVLLLLVKRGIVRIV